MPSTRRAPFPHKGFIGRKGAQKFSHTLTTGAAGAITTQESPKDSGITAAKQGTAGQYLLTLPQGYRKVLDGNVMLLTAITAIAQGCVFDFETNNIDGTTAGTSAGNILLQFRRNDTLAAADLPNPCTWIVTLEVAEGV